MTVVADTQQIISEQEYLDGEKISDTRHEYIAGYVYAMAGSSKRHAEIALNIASLLKQAARGTPCKTYVSDIKVRASSHKSYFYPDVVLGCESDETDDYYLESGNWWVRVFESPDDTFTLPCVELEVTLAEIYEDVAFNLEN